MKRPIASPRVPRAGPKGPDWEELVLARARYRAALVMVGVTLSYAVLALRAVPLMLMPDDRLQAKAATQFQQAVRVDAPRGDVLARDGTVLATTVEMPSLHADPSRIAPEEVDALADVLSAKIDVAPELLRRRLSQHDRQDVTLALQVAPERVAELEALAAPRAIWARDELTRYYPGRDLAAQVLGVVGHDGRGLEGLERQLDRHLRGSTYRFVQQRDRRGRVISTEVEARNRARAGDDVRLTIDPFIQRVAEDALDDIVERSEPDSAVAVVMDVRTGEVLALANRPTTNPNDRLSRDIRKLRNHAVADAHEPGSVLKPFVIALALEDGLVTPETPIDCENGRWRVGRSIINDDHPHAVVTTSEVVKYSSNIGTAKLAFELGAERLMEGLRGFGFTRRTDVGLPAEVSGFLRDPRRIRPIELATTAFGQGMTATAMQLTAALAALGNDGQRMQPLLVREISDRHGFIEVDNEPRAVDRPVSSRTAHQVLAMMASVLEEGGTGTRARIPGYTAAGKTGTAQKVVDGRYSATARVASWMGLAPATDPRIAIVVMTDTPHKGSRYGGTVSGPAFSYIGEHVLPHLGVAPDRLEEEEGEEPASEPPPAVATVGPELVWTAEGRLRLPDLKGLAMRDLLVAVDGSGLELAMAGSGLVVEQRPGPGADLNPGDRLEVTLR